MASSHLICSGCRIRVRADAPEIDVLEGCCPICGEALTAAASASHVLGFRSFGLDALSEQGPSAPPTVPGHPVGLAARREAMVARGEADAGRWSAEGSGLARAVAAELPAAH